MIEALHASRADVQEIQTAKCLKRGSFKQREYIEKISINDDMPMVEHYLANPDRYPEVV